MSPAPTRSVIALHLILTLYGHWAVNDPRGSGSTQFHDDKFQPLGPIHHGRKPDHQQPTREELRAFHEEHQQVLNFSIFWIDSEKRNVTADAFAGVIDEQNYTCWACAILRNHAHLVIRIHRDRDNMMHEHLAQASAKRLRLRFPDEIAATHPIWSARPYTVFLYTTDDINRTIDYINRNPRKEGLSAQSWPFVQPYNNSPHHKK